MDTLLLHPDTGPPFDEVRVIAVREVRGMDGYGNLSLCIICAFICMVMILMKEIIFTLFGQKNIMLTNDRVGLSRSAIYLFVLEINHAVEICTSSWTQRTQRLRIILRRLNCVQTTPHRTHTRALLLAADARTPDVMTSLAQGLDDLFVCLEKSFQSWSCLC